VKNSSILFLFALSFFFISTLFVLGCVPKAVTIPVNPEMSFTGNDPKIPLTVGLYADNDTNNYIIRHQLVGPLGPTDEYRLVAIGKALIPNAYNSLSGIFNKVQKIDSRSSSFPYIIELKIDPATSMDMGRFTFSEKSVDLHLQCIVKKGSGSVLWKKTISSKIAKSNPMGWTAGFAKYSASKSSNTKVQAAAEESLYLCLETLNSELLTNKSKIFR
jgi:hypothetical protein